MVSEWVSDEVSDEVSEWWSGWVMKWVSDEVSEWWSEWASEAGRDGRVSEREREGGIKFSGRSWAPAIEIDLIHISRIITTYTIGIITCIFTHTDNTQTTDHNWLQEKGIERNTKSEDTHYVDLSLGMGTIHQFTLFLLKLAMGWNRATYCN